MQVHEIKRSEYLRLLENLDWLPTNVECGMYESSIDHEYVVVCMGASFGKIYKYAPLFRGFDDLADAFDCAKLGECFEYEKAHDTRGALTVIFEYEVWHVVDEVKLEPSKPFRVWMLSNGDYTVDDWYARSGQACENLGLYTAKQMKDTYFVYKGIWPDYNNVVFAWCLNGYTGRYVKCKIVKRNRRLRMVTTYGDDVAVIFPYVEAENALAQLRAAAVM